ncbi:MAG: pseudouridine synthase [Thermomicrobiales bacterium]
MADDSGRSVPHLERLHRVLAARGVASRRKSEELIQQGRVTVNGKVVTELGLKIDPRRASIRVDGKPVRWKPFRYLLLNKPSGFITTTSDERGRLTVMDLLPHDVKLNPVGRLDRDTEGLLLFTNDGEVANRIMHPRYGLTKEYVVETSKKPAETTMQRVRAGIEIDGKLVVPHEFRIMRETERGVQLSIVLHEGINHVVRRLMDAVGIEVSHLRRTRVGPLSIAGVPRGTYRDLTPGEITSLFEAIHLRRDEEGVPSAPARKAERSEGTQPSGARSRSKPRPGATRGDSGS